MNAILSPCRTYRYWLKRELNSGKGTVLFIMLNPSTADEIINDPTISRCISYSRKWGYMNLEVCNIFALRSTDPNNLMAHLSPVGPDNDRYILEASERANLIIAAWGNHGKISGRGRKVVKLLEQYSLKSLGINASGHPKHPLYLKQNILPMPFYGNLT